MGSSRTDSIWKSCPNHIYCCWCSGVVVPVVNREQAINELERAVVEAAVRCRQDELDAPLKPPYNYDLGLRYFNNQVELKKACDAVIVARALLLKT